MKSRWVHPYVRHEVGQWYLKQYEEEGGQILAGTAVKSLDKEKSEITLENGEKIGYKYLIAADGSTSTITKALGFRSESVFAGEYRIENYSKEDTPLEVFVWPERIGYTYCWIMPMTKEEPLLASAVIPNTLRSRYRRR